MEGMTSKAQEFVNALNAQIMPKFGYVYRNGRWEWPDLCTGYWHARGKWDLPLVSTGEKL